MSWLEISLGSFLWLGVALDLTIQGLYIPGKNIAVQVDYHFVSLIFGVNVRHVMLPALFVVHADDYSVEQTQYGHRELLLLRFLFRFG